MSCLVQKGIDSFRHVAWTLTFAAILGVSACGGGGGGEGADAPAPPGSKLFIADSGNDAIGSFIDSNPSPGPITVDRVITGSNANLTGTLAALAIDATRDLLYVSKTATIVVFNGAGTANGNVGPLHTVATIGSVGDFTSLFIDAANDVLYVADAPVGVKAFTSASTANNSAPNTPAARTLTGSFGAGFSIRAVAVDVARDILYVAVLTSFNSVSIAVFDGASSANGNLPPNRSFSVPSAIDASIFLDSTHDRLYVSGSTGFIYVFENAHLADVGVAPVRTIDIKNSTFSKVAVDVANDRLFAMTQFLVYIINSVSTASGQVAASVGNAPPLGSLSAIAVKP